jgi:hypothetical protein
MGFLGKLFGRSDNKNKQTAWEDLGVIADEFEIQHLHPDHHNYPQWKGGERWLRLLKTNWGTHIVFTEGLSSNENKGYELYLESTDEIETFSSSWQANLIYEMGKIIPNVNDLGTRLQNSKFLSVQVSIDGAPEEWSLDHPNGNIGILLGLHSEHLSNFQPPYFTPLNVKLLRPAEMQYIINNGAEGRIHVANILTRQGNATSSSMDRSAVV